jgi:hypothetical protein
MNYETENFYDQEIEFTYEGKEYVWQGDYTIEHIGEDESEYAPAYGEMEICIDHTSSLICYEQGKEVIPSRSMLMALEIEIERNY